MSFTPVQKPWFDTSCGATIQRTDPIPPVSQPEQSRYSALNQNRYVVQATPQIHQGATVQQTYVFRRTQVLSFVQYEGTPSGSGGGGAAAATFTDPIFILSQPTSGYYLPFTNRYTDVSPKSFTGATVQASVPPVPLPNQPQNSNWYVPDVNRYVIGPRQFFDGATIQATVPIPPVAQPELRYWAPDISRAQLWIGPRQQFTGSTVQQTYIFPVSQPEGLAGKDQVRYRQDVRPFLETLIPPNQPWFIYPVNQPEQLHFIEQQTTRYRQDAFKQFTGATIQQMFPVLPAPVQLEPSRHVVPRFQPPVVPQFQGATVQDTAPIPPVSGPDLARYALQSDTRNNPGVVPQFSGATIQQTNPIPPVGQPQRANIEARQQPPVVEQLLGVTAAPSQTYVFPVSQPYFPVRPTIFPVTPQFQGATVQQTYVFTPYQPEMAYTALQQTRYRVPNYEPLESITSNVIVINRPSATVTPGGPGCSVSGGSPSGGATPGWARVIIS